MRHFRSLGNVFNRRGAVAASITVGFSSGRTTLYANVLDGYRDIMPGSYKTRNAIGGPMAFLEKRDVWSDNWSV